MHVENVSFYANIGQLSYNWKLLIRFIRWNVLFIKVLNNKIVKEVVLQRIKSFIKERDLSKNAFAKSLGMEQTTVNNQLIGRRGISIDLVLSFLECYPDISAEWLMRGKGEMLLNDDAEISTSSDNISEDDIRLLRERIISLEAENKVLREIAGLHQGERPHEGKIA